MKYLFVIFLAAFLAVVSLASSDDLRVAQDSNKFCLEMNALFVSSRGELGWPKGACN
tara:strand:- start:4267 stop:4437 length:171 start_codon:yes stop_codon:yes gene_type:complete